MIQRNAETVSTRSSGGRNWTNNGTFGRSVRPRHRLFRVRAPKAAQKSSHHIEAIVQSGTVLSEITQHLFEEWADIAQARMDRAYNGTCERALADARRAIGQ